MRAFICARCGGPIDGGDEDLCDGCLDTMPVVAVAIPADFDPDPDACERGDPPEGVHLASYLLIDHWNVNEFESMQLRRAPDGGFVVVHHFSNYEDSFWRIYGEPHKLESDARMIGRARAAQLAMEEAEAEAEARGDE